MNNRFILEKAQMLICTAKKCPSILMRMDLLNQVESLLGFTINSWMEAEREIQMRLSAYTVILTKNAHFAEWLNQNGIFGTIQSVANPYDLKDKIVYTDISDFYILQHTNKVYVPETTKLTNKPISQFNLADFQDYKVFLKAYRIIPLED